MSLTWSRSIKAQGAGVARARVILPMAIKDVCDNGASRWAAQAKDIRPWTDRTSHAVEGITGEARVNGAEISIYCYHTMEYGPYLEFGTKYMAPRASIVPAMRTIAPEVVEDCQSVVGRLLGGGL